jgi:peptidoglycan/LPS O-acetylase OafA/YrhL
MLVQAALVSHPVDNPLLRFAVYVVATLAGGALLHYGVERPFLRWRHRRTQRTAEPSLPSAVT